MTRDIVRSRIALAIALVNPVVSIAILFHCLASMSGSGGGPEAGGILLILAYFCGQIAAVSLVPAIVGIALSVSALNSRWRGNEQSGPRVAITALALNLLWALVCLIPAVFLLWAAISSWR